MTLAQMYSLANSKTYYSRPDADVYGALDQAGFFVYAAVLKEFRGYFLKVDSTTVTLTPGTQEYTLPADLTQIVNIAERITTSENWHPMRAIDAEHAFDNIQQATGWDIDSYGYGDQSPFGFYGPFLDSTAAQSAEASQIFKIQVSPAIDTARLCEIVYTAKWLPITSSGSTVMLPDEGTHAMLNYACAELFRSNNDSLADKYEAKGDKALSMFLTWVRARQIATNPTIATYGPGW